MKEEINIYNEDNIKVLEGLEAVRKRPSMYIGNVDIAGLHHLVYEVVDNSIDEAMAGFCDTIKVIIHTDNSVSVEDNGRGIPVGIHKTENIPAVEVVMTKLHAGGKFDDNSYKVSGGLHGVGVSVVNALSSFLEVEIYSNGKIYYQTYEKGVKKSELKIIGKTRKKGTKVHFVPDLEILKTNNFLYEIIVRRLRELAFLNKGVKIIIEDERSDQKEEFIFKGGLKSFVEHLNRRHSILHKAIIIEGIKNDVQIDLAIQYNDTYNEKIFSFANNIRTVEGGFHLIGFKAALTRTINQYVSNGNLPKNLKAKITGDDAREGLTAIISVKIKSPQFEGQTKTKLGNTEVRGIVASLVFDSFNEYLVSYPNEAREIIGKCLLSARARLAARAARTAIIRKGVLEGMMLPGKLADCSTKDTENSELYIVEGDSAGGSAKQGRDRAFQAILPLRGKILNVERARLDRIISSAEIKALIIALGTGIKEQFNIKKLRYGRIIIMTDADVDGAHITTLLLTLFYRYFEPLIQEGHLFVAQSPLYRIQSGKSAEYAYADEDKEEIISEFQKEKGEKADKISIQRYKGLGEMNPNQLWETTMDPKNRIMKQITIKDAEEAEAVFETLMGSEVGPRKKFIQTHAKRVKNLDI